MGNQAAVPRINHDIPRARTTIPCPLDSHAAPRGKSLAHALALDWQPKFSGGLKGRAERVNVVILPRHLREFHDVDQKDCGKIRSDGIVLETIRRCLQFFQTS